ncbi:FadR/GntR family transcriptional regulator [Roseibium sp.]|uniref:FadR/GntR family transcriptional regulator n=1 Tax=Roseibium sp. TaxID=1936156 RepID=UPI003A984DCA
MVSDSHVLHFGFCNVFRKIDQVRTAESVIQQVEELILSGLLRPGDQLPPERDLALKTEVSRPVLREALKTLEMRGLLISRRGGGTYVADVIGPVFSEAVIALIERHPHATADYLEFRKDIEALAAGHAAERATPADHDILRDLVERMQKAYDAENLQLEAELDIEFHQAVGEAAHNIILMHSLRSCYRLLENGVFLNRDRLYDHPTARTRVLEQHKLIAERIIAGDAKGAREASAAHIEYVREAMEEADNRAARGALADIRLQRRTQSAKTASSRPLKSTSS